MTDIASSRPLEGKTVVITGSSRGLGAATARLLSRWGAKVVVTYRENKDAADAVVRDCSEATPGAWSVQLDLIEEESVREAFAEISEREERIDFLVANAAATALKPLMALKMHQIDKTFAISVRHFLLMVQLAYPALEKAGGRVIAVSGADTVGYIPAHGLLAAAKASMEMLVHYLGCELGPSGVTAVGVLPGFIDTDSSRMMTGPLHEAMKRGEEATHPLREAASPEQVADAIALMCLPEARWFNGQIMQNDGGGFFAMTGRYYQTAASQHEPGEPGSSPVLGI